MAITFEKTGTPTADGITILLYGVPGCGKTRLIGELPNPVFIDVERGYKSIRKPGVDIIKPTSYRDLIQIIAALNKGVMSPEGFRWTIEGKEFCNRIIVADTLDAISTLILDEVLKGKGIEKAGWDEWGIVINRSKEVTSSLRNLQLKGVHFIATAHEEMEKNPDSNAIKGQPALLGKLSEKFSGMFDAVYRMTVKNGKRYLDGQPVGIWTGKDRYDVVKTSVDVTDPKAVLALWDQITATHSI